LDAREEGWNIESFEEDLGSLFAIMGRIERRFRQEYGVLE
jgi:hypothetical protein